MAATSGHMLRPAEYAPDLELGIDNISGGRQFSKSLSHCQNDVKYSGNLFLRTVPAVVAY
jgi:hypothetical protein